MIVLWTVGIIICFTLLLTPKKYVRYCFDGVKKVSDKPTSFANAELRWEHILPISLTSLIVGGLLIYTFRTKKNDKK